MSTFKFENVWTSFIIIGIRSLKIRNMKNHIEKSEIAAHIDLLSLNFFILIFSSTLTRGFPISDKINEIIR